MKDRGPLCGPSRLGSISGLGLKETLQLSPHPNVTVCVGQYSGL